METNNQNFENNCTRVKTGSGAVIEISNQQNETPEALKSTLETRCGDLGKSGPGARAKADARRNSKDSGSTIIPGVNGFVPQNLYCQYHKADPPLSCKSSVKVSDSPFQDNGGDNQPLPENPFSCVNITLKYFEIEVKSVKKFIMEISNF